MLFFCQLGEGNMEKSLIWDSGKPGFESWFSHPQTALPWTILLVFSSVKYRSQYLAHSASVRIK